MSQNPYQATDGAAGSDSVQKRTFGMLFWLGTFILLICVFAAVTIIMRYAGVQSQLSDPDAELMPSVYAKQVGKLMTQFVVVFLAGVLGMALCLVGFLTRARRAHDLHDDVGRKMCFFRTLGFS